MAKTTLYRAYVNEQLVYVGVSKSGIRRLSEHNWRADRVEMDLLPTRKIALERETALIKEHNPVYNIMHRVIENQEKKRRVDTKPFKGTAADILKAGRAMAKLTQQELATAAGVAQQTISAYETGRKEPSLPMLMAVLAAADLELRFHLEPDTEPRAMRR